MRTDLTKKRSHDQFDYQWDGDTCPPTLISLPLVTTFHQPLVLLPSPTGTDGGTAHYNIGFQLRGGQGIQITQHLQKKIKQFRDFPKMAIIAISQALVDESSITIYFTIAVV